MKGKFYCQYLIKLEYKICSYKVYRLEPLGKQQLEMLGNLRNGKNLDFWTPLRRDGHAVDIMINPEQQKWFVDLLEKNHIRYKTLIDDVER